jgi:hypothetical protein
MNAECATIPCLLTLVDSNVREILSVYSLCLHQSCVLNVDEQSSRVWKMLTLPKERKYGVLTVEGRRSAKDKNMHTFIL